MYESEELASKVLLAWSFSSKQKSKDEPYNNPEIVEGGDFFSTMIYRKLKAFGVDIKIPDECYLLISVCSKAPGYAQLLMKEFLSSIPNLKPGYEVTAQDFVNKYPMQFPTQENPEWDKHFMELWDQQKVHSDHLASDNLCDTKEWWLELFN